MNLKNVENPDETRQINRCFGILLLPTKTVVAVSMSENLLKENAIEFLR